MVGVTKYCKLQYKMVRGRGGRSQYCLKASNPRPSEPLQINLFGEHLGVHYSEVLVKSSRQEFAKVLFKVLGFPGEHGLLQVQGSAPELRVRQGPPNQYISVLSP